MAWTKAKSVIFTSAVVILLATAGTVTVENYFRHAPPRQTGRLKLPTGNVTPMVACGYSQLGNYPWASRRESVELGRRASRLAGFGFDEYQYSKDGFFAPDWV